MKLTFDRERWLSLIEQPCAAIANRSILPILSFISISIGCGRLTVTGTDLITTATRFTETDQPDESICVEAKKLIDVIRAMPKGVEIALETKESTATLKSGRSRFKLETANAQDYPNPLDECPKATMPIEYATLETLIDFAQHAMANKDVRYYMNGLFLQHSTGRLTIIATNGHRAAVKSAPIESPNSGEFEVIVDRNSVPHLKKFLAASESTATLAALDRRIVLSDKSGSVSCQLINGKYPDMRLVTPTTAKIVASVDRIELIELANLVALASDNRDNPILLSVFSDKIKLVALKGGDEVGEDEIDAVVPFDTDSSDALIEYGINPTYLVDALESFSEDEVIMRFTDAIGALRIDVGGDRDPFADGACCVIMPCRI